MSHHINQPAVRMGRIADVGLRQAGQEGAHLLQIELPLGFDQVCGRQQPVDPLRHPARIK
jgi:hypothetical protein